jgi:hypothetical protein
MSNSGSLYDDSITINLIFHVIMIITDVLMKISIFIGFVFIYSDFM